MTMTSTSGMRGTFHEKRARFNLKPEETSIAKLASMKRGITDRVASSFELACMDAGLDHTKSSFTQLASKKLGSKSELSLPEIKRQLGENWVDTVCEYSW